MKDYFNTHVSGVGYYGMHMLATYEGLSAKIRNTAAVEYFLMELCDRIDMERYGPPMVYRFGVGHEIGLSGFQLITTSAISLHTNDPHRDLYLDVFSCKDYDPEVVNSFVKEAFGEPEKSSYQIVLRR